jgi:hypothetical protein
MLGSKEKNQRRIKNVIGGLLLALIAIGVVAGYLLSREGDAGGGESEYSAEQQAFVTYADGVSPAMTRVNAAVAAYNNISQAAQAGSSQSELVQTIRTNANELSVVATMLEGTSPTPALANAHEEAAVALKEMAEQWMKQADLFDHVAAVSHTEGQLQKHRAEAHAAFLAGQSASHRVTTWMGAIENEASRLSPTE